MYGRVPMNMYTQTKVKQQFRVNQVVIKSIKEKLEKVCMMYFYMDRYQNRELCFVQTSKGDLIKIQRLQMFPGIFGTLKKCLQIEFLCS